MDSFEAYMICIIVVIVALLGLSIIELEFWHDDVELFVDSPLHNLQDESQIHGSFSLGSGYIDEEPCFVFYEMEDNGYVLRSVPADKSKIIEDENDKPFIRRYETYSEGRLTRSKMYHDWRFEFHVPQGTIIKEWYLDAKLR